MKPVHSLIQAALITLIIANSPFTSAQSGKQLNENLDRHGLPMSSRETSISNTLSYALRRANLPGGIVVSSYCEGVRTHSLKPANDTLRALLDAAAAAEPDYGWTVDNGVVNWIPRYDESKFLNTTITKLEISDAQTTSAALEELLTLPEVQKQARFELGVRTVTGGLYGYNVSGKKVETKRISVSARALTVREALNAIARADGNGIWILIRGECLAPDGRKFFSLDFVNGN